MMRGADQGALLGVADGISVVIGIVVGVSLYKAPALVFGAVPSPAWGLALWALGGLLSLVGALCYAELATAYPRSGGDYVYLTAAYGPSAGFLFGWAQLVAILTGSIGAMAYVYGDYAANAFGGTPVAHAVTAVVGISAVNLLGVSWGRPAQNLLTLAKLVGLAGLLVAGAVAAAGEVAALESAPGGASFGFALILVLYAYGGWNDAAYVAAEVRDPARNIPRILIGGTAGIAVLYLLVNTAYLAGLGWDGVRASVAPASDLLGVVVGSAGGRVMSVLVMVSALGAIQGLVFTGSRVYAAVGVDHPLFRALGRWHPRLGAPMHALLVQGGVTLLLVLAVGTEMGRGMLDAALRTAGWEGLPWQRSGGGFETLVAATAPVFWIFFLLTGASLLRLRRLDPQRERPFRVPLYPLLPLLFCATSVYMLVESVRYAGELTLLGVLPLILGLPAYAWSARR